MSAKNFIKRLKSIGRFHKMDDDKMALYLEKLSGWRLSEKQWTSAFDKIADAFSDLPSLPEIYPFLRAETAHGRAEAEINWQTWRDPEGRHWAKKQPGPRYREPYEAISWEEGGREAFAEAYVKAGGNPANFPEYQAAMTEGVEYEAEEWNREPGGEG